MKEVTINGMTITVTEDTAKLMLEQAHDVIDQLGDTFDEDNENELNTFQDCWEKVNRYGGYYISSSNDIRSGELINYHVDNMNVVPREDLAKKIQLYTQLLVVAEALNDGEEVDNGCYVVEKHGTLDTGFTSNNHKYIDILYKDEETAEKAIEIAGFIYKEYFNLE